MLVGMTKLTASKKARAMAMRKVVLVHCEAGIEMDAEKDDILYDGGSQVYCS